MEGSLTDKLLELRRMHLAREELFRLMNDTGQITKTEKDILDGRLNKDRASLVGQLRALVGKKEFAK